MLFSMMLACHYADKLATAKQKNKVADCAMYDALLACVIRKAIKFRFT